MRGFLLMEILSEELNYSLIFNFEFQSSTALTSVSQKSILDGLSLKTKPTTMKKLLFMLIAVVLFSCKDRNTATSETSERIATETISADTLPPENLQKERDALQTEKATAQASALPATGFSGKYRKSDSDKGTDCNCNCIEVSYDRPTEWCIDKDKMYISARCEKTGENTANVYFVAASRESSPDKPLPWDEFDTNTPVATLTFQPDGSTELDWLGFSKDGEIITEYALYGKKSLEGTYTKE